MEARWVVALACIVLLCSQTALALHEIDHLSHPHDGVCELCAMGVGHTPIPAMVPGVLTLPPLLEIQSPRPDPVVRDRRVRRVHSARAPPDPLLTI